MNILYVLKYFPVFGGGETVTLNLCNELVTRGNNVYIVYFEDTTNRTDILPYVDSIINTAHLSKDKNRAKKARGYSCDTCIPVRGGLVCI